MNNFEQFHNTLKQTYEIYNMPEYKENTIVSNDKMCIEYKEFLEEIKDILYSENPTKESYLARINNLLLSSENKSLTYTTRLKMLKEILEKF